MTEALHLNGGQHWQATVMTQSDCSERRSALARHGTSSTGSVRDSVGHRDDRQTMRAGHHGSDRR